ncbi:MAG: hypothetical protein K6E40_02290 [Desulfovibrio sp.]|nr:hypothetical protein [Desulfovibrio sp.]
MRNSITLRDEAASLMSLMTSAKDLPSSHGIALAILIEAEHAWPGTLQPCVPMLESEVMALKDAHFDFVTNRVSELPNFTPLEDWANTTLKQLKGSDTRLFPLIGMDFQTNGAYRANLKAGRDSVVNIPSSHAARLLEGIICSHNIQKYFQYLSCVNAVARFAGYANLTEVLRLDQGWKIRRTSRVLLTKGFFNSLRSIAATATLASFHAMAPAKGKPEALATEPDEVKTNGQVEALGAISMDAPAKDQSRVLAEVPAYVDAVVLDDESAEIMASLVACDEAETQDVAMFFLSEEPLHLKEEYPLNGQSGESLQPLFKKTAPNQAETMLQFQTEASCLPQPAALPATSAEATCSAQPATEPVTPAEASCLAQPATTPATTAEATCPALPATTPVTHAETSCPAQPVAVPVSPAEATCPAQPATEPVTSAEATCPALPATEPATSAEATCPAQPVAVPVSPAEATCPALPATEPVTSAEATCPALPATEPVTPAEATREPQEGVSANHSGTAEGGQAEMPASIFTPPAGCTFKPVTKTSYDLDFTGQLFKSHLNWNEVDFSKAQKKYSVGFAVAGMDVSAADCDFDTAALAYSEGNKLYTLVPLGRILPSIFQNIKLLPLEKPDDRILMLARLYCEGHIDRTKQDYTLKLLEFVQRNPETCDVLLGKHRSAYPTIYRPLGRLLSFSELTGWQKQNCPTSHMAQHPNLAHAHRPANASEHGSAPCWNNPWSTARLRAQYQAFKQTASQPAGPASASQPPHKPAFPEGVCNRFTESTPPLSSSLSSKN